MKRHFTYILTDETGTPLETSLAPYSRAAALFKGEPLFVVRRERHTYEDGTYDEHDSLAGSFDENGPRPRW